MKRTLFFFPVIFNVNNIRFFSLCDLPILYDSELIKCFDDKEDTRGMKISNDK